ncbi:nuclear transport factor 2 family protein [Aquipuribacter nitratireducens]|uniref:Nuclear transport factor 2 family protein n=1 Tax=Aquipuribacter nitratireducens TaxID=650104 RepID=A0ABW0GLJ9_9MICO
MDADARAAIDLLLSESQINRLVREYCHGVDKRDADRFMAVWAEDAVWQVGPEQVFRGHTAILDGAQRQWDAFGQMHHWAANVVIDIEPGEDRATGESDVDVTVEMVDGRWVRGGGTYRDQYVREHGQWKIARREAVAHFHLYGESADIR